MVKKYLVIGLLFLFATVCFADANVYMFIVKDPSGHTLSNVKIDCQPGSLTGTFSSFYTNNRGTSYPYIYVPGNLPPTNPDIARALKFRFSKSGYNTVTKYGNELRSEHFQSNSDGTTLKKITIIMRPLSMRPTNQNMIKF